MRLTLSFKTKRHHWKWNINRTLELLSYPLIAILFYIALVVVMCFGSPVGWM